MFLKTQRMTGQGSDILIIEPSHYLDFFASIKLDQSLALEFKAFLAVAVSGGCRVSEALSLKVGDIKSDGHFRVRVLKKRTEEPILRPCMLCPDALEIVQAYTRALGLSAWDKLFKFHRSTVHRKIKKYFGESACSHSIARHSHISWLLHEQDISTEKVAVEMRMLTHVVDAYNHANIEIEQASRFKKGA